MAFGKYRHSNIQGDKGTNWNIEIWKDGYTGSSSEFSTRGEGFTITWSGSGGKRTPTFLGSQLTLNFLIENGGDEDFVYDVLDNGFQSYYIRIYKGAVIDDNIWWYGWIQPSFDTIQNAPYPYTYNLVATDSVGYLDQLKPSSFADENDKRSSSNLVTEFFNTFQTGSYTGLNIGGSTANNLNPAPDNYEWLRTSADWWREGDELLYNTTNPLSLYSISKGGFAEETKYNEDGEIVEGGNPLQFKAQEVFRGICRLMGLRGFLSDGRYNIIQPNLLQNNNSGALKTYNYTAFAAGSSVDNINTILSIDQNNNNLLGGSSFTYEPPLESASLSYSQGKSTFEISAGTNIETTAFPVGYLIANSGMYKLTFIVHNYIAVLKDDFNFNTNPNHDVFSNSYTNTCNIEIKLSDGVDNYYLQVYDDTSLEWVLSNSAPLTLDTTRGRYPLFASPLNNSAGGMSTYDVSNNPQWDATDIYPCKRTQFTSGPGELSYEFRTLIRFIADVHAAPISGSVTLKTTSSNVYLQRAMNTADFNSSINTPTPTYNRTDAIALTYEPIDDNEVNTTPTEVVFRATQDEVIALDTEDLGTLPIGQRMTGTDDLSIVSDKLYSIQYTDGIEIKPAIQGFRNGNSGNYAPIMRLVCEEYLTPQVKPLQILQANIKSADISPMKVVRYSLNNDSNYEYYQFLGGTFKANSEVMSGEWYKLESEIEYVTGGISSFKPIDSDPTNSENEQISRTINNIHSRDTAYRDFDVYGVLDTELEEGVSADKVEFAVNSLGKIYDNQRLRLSLPDGSNSIVVISDGDNLTTSDQVNIDAFTPLITYPVGSLLSAMVTDLSNVITGSDNLTPGVNETTIYIQPQRFDVSNDNNMTLYSRKDMGSIQGTESSRIEIYASTFIPAGYQVEAVDVWSNQNRDFDIKESAVDVNTTTSIQSGGVCNTTLFLTTPLAATDGKYLIITYYPRSTTDEIYGAKITIDKT